MGLCLDFSWLLIPCFGSVRRGRQPLIQLLLTQELFVCAPRQPALIRAPTHPGFQVWAPRRTSARLPVSTRADFPRSQSRAEGGGALEAAAAAAAAESSLTSNYVPLFSFPFEKLFQFKPPLVQTSTWLLTQPSLALSQESCSRPRARAGL